MIGNGGLANVNHQAGPAPRFLALYRITNARQIPSAWEYELTDLFNGKKWIRGDDPGYGLSAVVVAPPNPLAGVIAGLLRLSPAGSPADWAPQGGRAITHADGVGMGEQVTKSNDDANTFILWSGGAGDCVIVAAHGASASYITHRDRNAPRIEKVVSAITTMCAGAKQVYLASQVFGSGRPEDSDLVAETVIALRAAPNIQLAAVYRESALALNTRNGQIRTGLLVSQQLKAPFL